MKHFKEYQLADKTYKLNLWILWIASFLILGLLFFIFYQDNFTGNVHGYSFCANNSANRESNGCFNGFYNSTQCRTNVVNSSSPLCTTSYMFPGQELGEKSPWYFNNFWWILAITFIVAFILNTLLFNRHYFNKSPPIIDNKGIGGTI